MLSGCRSAVLAGAFIASGASAGLVNPLVPSWRGSANTMFMGWENFTAAYAGANAADMSGSSNLANLFNFGPGAILTNAPLPTGIYNPTGPLSIMIMGGVTSAPRNPTEVVMNVASAGTGIVNSTVALTLFDNAGNSKRLVPTTTLLRNSAPDGEWVEPRSPPPSPGPSIRSSGTARDGRSTSPAPHRTRFSTR